MLPPIEMASASGEDACDEALDAWLSDLAGGKLTTDGDFDSLSVSLPPSALEIQPGDELFFVDFQREIDEVQDSRVAATKITHTPEIKPLPHQRADYGTYTGNVCVLFKISKGAFQRVCVCVCACL